MNRSPLYPLWKELGARFKEAGGWELPDHFGSVQAEWKAVRTHAGVLDLAHRGKILVTGKDRAAFLHNMLSNDIKGLGPGECRYAALLTPKGKIISDMHVFAEPQFHLLELEEANVSKVIETLNAHIIGEEVKFKNASEAFSLVSLQGPNAERALGPILNDAPEIHAFENNRTGEKGFDLWVGTEHLEKLRDKIQSAGKIPAVGFSAANTLRIEAGIPWFGWDLDGNTIPNEADLERAISWTKGCYPGQEVVARIKHRGGVQRKLCGIELQTGEPAEREDRVVKDGIPVGAVTSAAFSFYLNSPVALAYLKTCEIIPDHEIQVVGRNGKISRARIHPLPFYKKT